MIPLYKPFIPKVPKLHEILNSGKLAYGTYGAKFELSIKTFIGNENVITTNSFNLAILIALKALGLKPGDKIVASPMACLSSSQPLLNYGLEVIWADIDPETGTISPESFENLIVKYSPSAIMHNHFAGYLGKIEEINKLAKNYNLLTIDDGIEGFGSEYGGFRLGNLESDATVFSFSAVRLPNVLDGGAVAFRKKETYEKSIILRDAGINRSLFRLENGEINPKTDVLLNGYSATLDELRSYIGYSQMKYLPNLIKRQRINALKWEKKVNEIDFLKPLKVINNSNPNYWIYGLLIDPNMDKNKAIDFFKQKGFKASGVHIDNSIYSVFKNQFNNRALPGVKEFQSRFVGVPSGWWLDE